MTNQFGAETELPDEQNLIARAQKGDTFAYEQLMKQYETLAFRVAYLIVRDEQDAAEVAQDAFLRAYRALGSFRSDQPFRPWLLRIVTNLAINHTNAQKRQDRMTERYALHLMAEARPDSPDRVVSTRAQYDCLLQAMQKLSADDQALLALRYLLELPEGEIADSLKIARGTVKSRLHRTLARLREIIRRDAPDLMEWVTD